MKPEDLSDKGAYQGAMAMAVTVATGVALGMTPYLPFVTCLGAWLVAWPVSFAAFVYMVRDRG